jgi:hypothetical protein
VFGWKASRWSAFILACGLTACGGGGGGTTGTSTTDPGGTTTMPALSATVTSISGTAATNEGALEIPDPVTINVPTTGSYFYALSVQGTADLYVAVNGVTDTTYGSTNSAIGSTPELAYAIGETLHGSWSGAVFGINMITFGNPATFGAGTYQDKITFEACADAACTQPLFGGPLTIPVTYTVTGNPIPGTTDVLIYPTATLEESASQTATVAGTIAIQAEGMPPTGAYVITGASKMGLVTQTGFTSKLSPSAGTPSSGTIGFTLPPPANVGAGIYTDAFPINVCFDETCNKPESQGPWTGTVKYIVDPVAGQDYVQTSIDATVSGMVWDSQTARLYVITPGYSALDPNELLEIDPSTSTIDAAIELDNGTGRIEPGTLSVSDDGQYLYVAISDSTRQTDHIERLRTSDLGLDLSIMLPAFDTVNALQPAPGAPHTLAVEIGGNLPALVIYDDATALTNTLSSTSGNMLSGFIWGADAGTLYAMFNTTTGVLDAATVSASGLQVTRSFEAQQSLGGTPGQGVTFANNRIYWASGLVFDTATFTLGTSFDVAPLSFGAAVDAGLDRIFFATDDQPPGSQNLVPTIESFSLSSGSSVWLLRFPQENGIGQPTRWGTNGLALSAQSGGTNSLIIISGAIVTH